MENLMNKRDHDRIQKEIAKERSDLLTESQQLFCNFQTACKHPYNQLDLKVNMYEDEYGKTVHGWTDYTYTCLRCGALFTSKDSQLTVKAIRELLDDAIKKIWRFLSV